MFIFTSCTNNYIPKARILASTLKSFHPDWTFCLLLGETPPAGFVLEEEPFDRVVQFHELGIPDYHTWLFRHRVVEICTAAKGPALDYFLETEGHDKVMYLDPDIMVCNSLEPLEKMLDEHDVLLTPHQLAPQPTEQAVVDNEQCALRHGVFNLGFVAAARRGHGLDFARWWKERLLLHCYDDIPNGLFTDQRWCDLAPAFFSRLHIVRDPGYNAASWNLTDRTITRAADGTFKANDSLLRFYHFTGFDSGAGNFVTNLYGKNMPAVGELWAIYTERLAEFGHATLGKQRWVYMVFDDGTPITDEMRLLYRNREDLRKAFPNPFLPAGFLQWYRNECSTPAPESALQTPPAPRSLLGRCWHKGRVLKELTAWHISENGGFPQALPRLAKKALAKFRQHGLQAVFRSVWNGAATESRTPAAPLDKPKGDDDLPHLGRVLDNDSQLAELCALLAPEHRPVCLVEHDLGGGADTYAQQRVAQYLKEGRAMLRLRYRLDARRVELTACCGEATYRVVVDELLELADPRFPRFTHMLINELAGWYLKIAEPNPDMLNAVRGATAALLKVRQAHNATLEFLFHDFFALCPSITLVENSTRRFCNIPAVEDCVDGSRCLGQGCIKETFSMEDWRTAWSALLAQADTVVFFSNNSRRLVEKVYTFRPEQIQICSHTVPSFGGITLAIPDDGPMRVAVVGDINLHKGSEMVVALGQLLEQTDNGESIVVLGNLHADSVPKTVTVLGPYKHEDLPDLLAEQRVTVGFMASVCPETFSFVTHELVSLGLPLVSFDLGAHGETIAQLPNGRVAQEITAASALAALRDLDAIRRA